MEKAPAKSAEPQKSAEPEKSIEPSKSVEPAPPAKAAPPPAKPADTPNAKSAPPQPPVSWPTPKTAGGLMSVAPSFQDGKAPAAPEKIQAPAPDSKGAPAPAKDGGPAVPGKADGPAGQAKPNAPEAEIIPKDVIQVAPEVFKNLKKVFPNGTGDQDGRSQPYIPPVESSSLKTLVPGRRRLLLPAAHAVRLSRDRGRRRRDRPGRDAGQLHGHRPRRQEHEDQDPHYWGDARQFVELHQDKKQYDLIFGDAFNDFSVPWHLTTREFNEKLKKMLTPDGVYMINIIDVYESDAEAKRKAEKEIEENEVKDEAEKEASAASIDAKATPIRRVPRRLDQDRQAHLRHTTSISSGPTTRARGAARPSWSSPR